MDPFAKKYFFLRWEAIYLEVKYEHAAWETDASCQEHPQKGETVNPVAKPGKLAFEELFKAVGDDGDPDYD